MISNALILIRFNQSEMKRLYRIFKSECPSGLITEEVFHNIFSKFFPLGAESYNGKRNHERFSDIHFTLAIVMTKSTLKQAQALYFVFDRNSPDYAKLASLWCLLYSSYQICDMHIPYSNLFDLFSFPANVSSYSHYVFSALVQDDSEVITFEVNFCLRNKISIFPFPLLCIEGVLKSGHLIHFPGFCCGSLGPRERNSGGEVGVDISPLWPGRGRSHHQGGDGGRRHVGQYNLFLWCENLLVWMRFHCKYLAFKCNLRPSDARMDNIYCTEYNAKL